MSKDKTPAINPAPIDRDLEAPADQQSTQLAEWNQEQLRSVPGLYEVFMKQLEEVPESGDDATARIVAQILAAETPDQIDAAWNAEGMRDWVDMVVQINSIKRMPSDFTAGLGWFLVCNVTALGSGEEFVLTTGSVSIVAQLVRLHTINALPIQVVPRKAAKPSKNGYFPMHLELVRDVRARRRPQVIDQQPAAAVNGAAGAR